MPKIRDLIDWGHIQGGFGKEEGVKKPLPPTPLPHPSSNQTSAGLCVRVAGVCDTGKFRTSAIWKMLNGLCLPESMQPQCPSSCLVIKTGKGKKVRC